MLSGFFSGLGVCFQKGKRTAVVDSAGKFDITCANALILRGNLGEFGAKRKADMINRYPGIHHQYPMRLHISNAITEG